MSKSKSLEQNRPSHQPVRAQYRVIDEATRKRRSRQYLEQLERDNFHEDPHANLSMHKKAPRFDDKLSSNQSGGTSGASGGGRRHQHRTRILSFAAMLEEDAKQPPPNYMSVSAPPPDQVQLPDGKMLMSIPKRYFCSVCGFRSPYTCVVCGMRYCCIACLQAHKDTRCMKWTA